MQFTTILSLAIAAVVPALAADNAAQENIEASVYPLEFFHGPPTFNDGDASCFTSVTGEIHSVRQIPGITCHIYFDHNCGGDNLPVTVDIPDVVHAHHNPALSARCYR
ncbi:hypothetical protein AtubIFM54640_009063 [Aspergillus tubingensis]|nr:hypothetical protein AtubIFM54640_009063 [Aspergillus tubingensis]